MPKDELMQKKIRYALDQLTPDEKTKDRMYLGIMQRAAERQRKKRPWYLRWQTSAGICTAALACVVVIAAAVHTKLPQDGAEQLEVIPPQPSVTAIAAEKTDLPAQTTATITAKVQTSIIQTESKPTASQAANAILTESAGSDGETQTITVIEAQAQENTSQDSESYESENIDSQEQAVGEESVETSPAQTDISTEKTAIVVPETKPVEQILHTEPVTVQTQPAAETTPTEDSSEIGGDMPPIRQNIYLYNMLSWDGMRYQTEYVLADSLDLVYLGAGATDGTDVNDTYTVLVYEINGVDPEEQLAVQYAGENCYYIFTAA